MKPPVEIKKPKNIYLEAVITKNNVIDNRTVDQDNKPVSKAVRLEFKPQIGPMIPKMFPGDGRLVIYIHDGDMEKWIGMDVGRRYKVLLEPLPTEGEVEAMKSLKKAEKNEA